MIKMTRLFDSKDNSCCVSNSSDFAEKRRGRDRRTHQFPKWRYLFFSGRRAHARRQVVAILMLSVLDALLTLYLIDNGSTELNPVMSYFIEYGPYVFMGAKYLLTCTGVIILLLFRNVLRKRSITHTQHVFTYIIAAFSTVIAWELYLILFIVS
jgi:hypothetical protein